LPQFLTIVACRLARCRLAGADLPVGTYHPRRCAGHDGNLSEQFVGCCDGRHDDDVKLGMMVPLPLGVEGSGVVVCCENGWKPLMILRNYEAVEDSGFFEF
jgi:hypothetical protein